MIGLILGSICHGQSPLSVSDARASQRAGTKLVDVYYDIAGGAAPYSVTLEGSSDGGATWTLPVTSVSGDVGSGVTEGTNLRVTWDAGADWPAEVSGQVRFRVTANDTAAAPDGFALIPAGPFTMGRTSGDTDLDAPPVSVTVDAFYMGKYEVTNASMAAVMNWALGQGLIAASSTTVQNTEGTAQELLDMNDADVELSWNGTQILVDAGKENFPVQEVSWYGAVAYANYRSLMEERQACYSVGGTWACDFSKDGYRLPTEAEWEKAARGGVSGKRFPWGTDTINHSNANYRASGSAFAYDTSPYTSSTYHPDWDDDGFPHTSSVGSFAPNGYGLYDVAGNVWEWCYDRYGSGYYTNGAVNPTGPASGTDRVLRGGSWNSGALSCRAAYRYLYSPASTSDGVGFRLARSAVP